MDFEYFYKIELNENTAYGEKLLKLKDDYVKEVEKNKIIYKKNIEAYMKLIKLISLIVKEIGLKDNSISYSIVTSKLLNSGFLSKNLIFTKQQNDLFDIEGYLGIDVINGYGCCRNSASLHKNVFDQLNLFNNIIPCAKVENQNLRDLIISVASHVVNLIEYEGAYYIHDIIYNIFAKFEDGFIIDEYFNKQSYLFYKPEIDFIFYSQDFKKVINNIKNYKLDSRRSHIDNSKLKDIILETENRFNSSNDAIKNYVISAQPYIKAITNLTI